MFIEDMTSEVIDVEPGFYQHEVVKPNSDGKLMWGFEMNSYFLSANGTAIKGLVEETKYFLDRSPHVDEGVKKTVMRVAEYQHEIHQGE